MAKSQPEVQHSSSSFTKVNKEGRLVLSSTLEPGEIKATPDNEAEVRAAIKKARAKK